VFAVSGQALDSLKRNKYLWGRKRRLVIDPMSYTPGKKDPAVIYVGGYPIPIITAEEGRKIDEDRKNKPKKPRPPVAMPHIPPQEFVAKMERERALL
jgi:hypothetical protein